MPVLFAATLFVSAFLLFLVQPLVGKLVLPLLGGAPAAWATCMVFFQAVLLAGYAYAHLLSTRIRPGLRPALHAVVLALPLLALPVALPRDAAPPADVPPALWLLGLLTVAAGAPVFAVATTAPLVQRWFAGTAHPSAHDPYFLYAASNVGSLLALVAYPFAVEPRYPLADQGRLWAWGYVGLLALIGACAAVARWWRGEVVKSEIPPSAAGGLEPATAPPLTTHYPTTSPPHHLATAQRLRWLLLAFIPSSLLLGATTALTTDVAPIPLLWVAPLALYLLSYVHAFARRPPLPMRVLAAALPVLALCLTLAVVTSATEPLLLLIALHLATFFAAALVCHGLLAKSRPPAERLTEFYLWVAAGGVLGGLFNALIAPAVFARVGRVEYGLALCLALAVAPAAAGRRLAARDLLAPLGVGLLTVAAAVAAQALSTRAIPEEWGRIVAAAPFAVPLVLCATLMDRPVRFALGLGAILLASGLAGGPHGRTLFYRRTVYGDVLVTAEPRTGWHRLVHGNTIHGRQAWGPDGPGRTPLGYYHPRGPAGSLFKGLAARGGVWSVAVCGLGVGALAAYATPDQRWTFYELDPTVVRVAEDPALFTYLRDAFPDPAACDVIVGDARLSLTTAPDGGYDLIVLDAFSSDAIPVHLLTREAVALYLRKLASGGVLAVHVSNRYLDLAPVLAALARDAGLGACRVRDDLAGDLESGWQPSVWVALARADADLGPLATSGRWAPAPPTARPVWTDDFSHVLGALRWEPVR